MSATQQETERDLSRELRSTPRPRTLERSFGLIAGILFIGGAFAGIPSSLLIDPAPPASLYLLTVAGVAVGLAAMVIPWERISRAWAHAAMIVAIVQVALTVALAGDPFVFYFVFIAIFAAYAFSDRDQVAIYIGLIAIALLAPIILIPDSTRATAAQAMAAIPAIALVAVMVAFLRERLEDNRRTTRRFAREALALSVRIGRLPAEPAPAGAGNRASSAPRHPRWRRVAISVSATLVAVAGLGTLAAAGVALPGPIAKPFASVGIEPGDPAPARSETSPDQDEAASSRRGDGAPSTGSASDSEGSAEDTLGRRKGVTSAANLQGGAPESAFQPSSGSTPSAGSGGTATTSESPSPATSTPSGPDPAQPRSPQTTPTPPAQPPAPPSIPDIGGQIGSALDNLLNPKN